MDGENEDEEEGMYLSIIFGNLLYCIVASNKMSNDISLYNLMYEKD